MLANERLELVHQSRTSAECKVCFDPLLERAETKLLQPGTLLLEEAPIGDVGKRRTAPERQCLAQPLGRQLRITRGKGFPAFRPQALEAIEIELVRLHSQAISSRLSDQALAPVRGGCEPATQAGDVDLDHLRRALRRRLVP